MTKKELKNKLHALLLEGCEIINLHLAYKKGTIPHVNVNQAIEIFLAIIYPNEKTENKKQK